MGTVAEHRLTASERVLLDEDGYVLREGVFSAAEVAEITDACERLLADLVKDRQGRSYHVGSYTFEPERWAESWPQHLQDIATPGSSNTSDDEPDGEA